MTNPSWTYPLMKAIGIEIEFMQVYTPEQLKEYEAFKGI